MAFIKLEDLVGNINAVVFPKVYEEFKDLLNPGVCVVIKGRTNKRNGELSFVADKIKAL